MSEYLDYKQFRSQFDFIFLSGLKGQERVCEIQDKDTNKMYDYKEIIKEGEDIEKQKELCKELTTLSHPNLLKLQYYSYCFIEETHGNPYCKFFLVFEYCESSLDREIQTLLKKKKFMKTHRMTNIFISLISSLHYLHGMKTTHGDLIPEFVCLTEKDEYKLMPQIQVKPKKNYKLSKFKSSIKDIYKKKPNIHRISMEITEEKKKNEKKTVQNKNLRKESDDILTPPNDFDFSKTYCSPEVYIDDKNRVAYERLKIDPFLSEIFSLGMLFLSVGILENLNQFYKTFTVDTNFLNEKLVKFETLHGKRLFSILCKFLEIDPIKRCSLESALEYLNSEKEIYSPYMPSRGVEDMKKNLKMNKSSKKLLKNQAFSSDLEEKDENALTKKLFNQLPQEHQDEIDKKISEQLRIIEDEKYPTDMFISGDRYQGQKEDDIPHGWGIYWWANGERYEGFLIYLLFIKFRSLLLLHQIWRCFIFFLLFPRLITFFRSF